MDDLFDRYADGTLSAAERAEFLRLLETPEGRRRFAELSAYEAALGEEARLANERGLPEREARPSSRTLPAVRRRRVPPRDSGNAGLKAALGVAAAVLLVGVLLAVAFSSGPAERAPVARPVAPIKPPDVPAPAPRVEPVVPHEAPKPPPPPQPLPDRTERTPAPFVPPPPAEAPKPAPAPVPAPAPRPEPAAREVETTLAFIAELERAQGEVLLAGAKAAAGKGIASGQALVAGRDAYASVRFPDGTRLEISGATQVGRIADGVPGKAIQIEEGYASLDAAKQPAGKPLVISTPHAEATVLGTEFTLHVTPAFTRLDVREGRVKLTRLPAAVATVTVGAGQFAIAGKDHEFASRTGPSGWRAPGGAMLWLKADAGVRPGVWQDQSGNGLHATQPAAGAQPALVTGAGGRPALRFDGLDDHYVLPAGFSDFRAGLSVFAVLKVPALPVWMRVLDLDQPTCDNITFGFKGDTQTPVFWVYANSATKGKVEAPGAGLADHAQSLSAVMLPHGRVTLFRGGRPVGAGATSVPLGVSRTPCYLGKSNYGAGDPAFKGELSEILLYPRALADAERAHVEAYLAMKYFDPTAPPAFARPAEK